MHESELGDFAHLMSGRYLTLKTWGVAFTDRKRILGGPSLTVRTDW